MTLDILHLALLSSAYSCQWKSGFLFSVKPGEGNGELRQRRWLGQN